MKIHDLNDYYKPKNKPLLPIIVAIVGGIIVVALIIACFLPGDKVDEKGGEQQTEADALATAEPEATPEGLTIKDYSEASTTVVKEEVAATLSAEQISSAIDQGNKAMQAGKFEAARNLYLSAYEGLGTTDLQSQRI